MFEQSFVEARGRRRLPPAALALSFLLHVLAVEAWLVLHRLHPQAPPVQRIDVLLSGGAVAPDAPPLTPAQKLAEARRQEELARLVQPLAVPAEPQVSARAAAGGTPVQDSAENLPVEAGGKTTRPIVIESTRVLPPYPEEAQRQGLEGDVIVRAVIDELGQVATVEVVRGLSAELDRAAVAAVRKWRFKPATRDGTPVKVYYLLTLNFRL